MQTTSWTLVATFAVALAAPGVWAPEAWAHGGTTHAIEELSEEIARQPGSAKLYLLRADAWRIESRYEKALSDVRHARKAGANVEADLLEGRVLLEARRPKEAVAVLDRLLSAHGDSFLGLWLRARAHRDLKHTRRATADYASAAKLARDVDFFAERGAFLETHGPLTAAIENYRTGLSRIESDLLREALWRIELRDGNPDAAIAAIAPTLERARLKSRWLVRRAEAHEAAGRTKQARADRQRALTDVDAALKNRRSPLLLIERAHVHTALGDHVAALADAEEAARRAPKYAPATTLYAKLREAGR